MAALDADDLTVVVTERWQEGVKRHCRGTIAIAATDTYPTGGIPLPVKGKFGMDRSVDVLVVSGSAGTATQYMYGYDKTNYKLLLYEEEGTAAGGPLLEADTSEVPGARTVFFYAIGW